MQAGDFVYIDYVGRVKDTGEIFDLTKEDVAKKEGVYNSNFKYRPIPAIVDANFVLKGLDEALKEMKVGERRVVDVPPEKGFGERRGELARLIPLFVFKEQNVDPTPGSYVTINGLNGRVISIDGGRVKVDFNHPLAGKKLEYDVEIIGEIKDIVEKVKTIVNFYTGVNSNEIEVTIKDKEAEVSIKKRVDLTVNVKETIFQTINKWIKEIERVKFTDVYESK